MILAGDIGGTKTHLALFEWDKGHKIIFQEKLPSKDYGDLSEIIRTFLKEKNATVDKACFGVAGPVQNGRCAATNLPWVIDEKELAAVLGTDKTYLINDLEANAYGINCLKPDEFCVLYEGEPKAQGNAALASAGTGLGEAGLYYDGTEFRPFATEGGHTGFAPRNELEIELLRYIKGKYGHVSWERLVSGPGIDLLYHFLIKTGKEQELEEIREDFADFPRAQVITQYALKGKCPACVRTVEWFVSLYGSEAGNLALKMLSTGGVYLGGGIAPKILEFMQKEIFRTAFLDKGRMSSVLEKMPIKIILNEDAALLGAAYYAQKGIGNGLRRKT